MEHNKFIQQLSEFAEITAIKIPAGPKIRQPKESQAVYRQGQEIAIDPKANPTQGVKIKRVKHQPKACEDCHLIVENRVVQKKIYEYPLRHWRENCSTCSKTRHPETGLFDIDTERSQSYFIAYLWNKNK